MPALAATLADTAGTVPDIWSKSGLIALAFFSVMAVKVLFGREVKSSDYHRDRADKAEAEVRRLNEAIATQHLPAVMRATEVMAQMLSRSKRGS